MKKNNKKKLKLEKFTVAKIDNADTIKGGWSWWPWGRSPKIDQNQNPLTVKRAEANQTRRCGGGSGGGLYIN